jgi:L-malate glycosyltransferase
MCNVLILIPCLRQGGTEMQTLSMSNVLRSCGHAIEVVCYFEHEPSMVKEFQATGASVRLLDMNRNSGSWTVIKRIRKEIQQINPDVVHVQYMAPGALPIIAARLAGVKTIFATVHQPYTRSHGWLAKLILRAASLLTTQFIAVSKNAEKSWFGSSILIDETKPLMFQPRHFTIYNAIDTNKVNKIVSKISPTDLKSELAIPKGVPVIGAVSRLRHEKGIDILLETFNLLIRFGNKAHLLLVGSGPDEKKLKDTVQKYGLSSYITFYGEAEWERATQLMALMDIVVVPSRFEGFGLTAAEAMAAGKPVVASDTSGLKEVVVNGETGILFPVDDVTELKEAIERLIKDSHLQERLGAAGKERVLVNFSLDLYSKKINALYNL